MTARLQVELEGEVLRSVALHGQVYRIGRDPDAELSVNHTAVSKRHALLEQIRGVWQISDCGSTNGLSWRGRRVQWLQLQHVSRPQRCDPSDSPLAWVLFNAIGSRKGSEGLGSCGYACTIEEHQ